MTVDLKRLRLVFQEVPTREFVSHSSYLGKKLSERNFFLYFKHGGNECLFGSVELASNTLAVMVCTAGTKEWKQNRNL